MPFPVTKRIIYKKNPLIEVICQFRFPPILSIDTEIPAKFQEAIKKEYPLFKENAEILVRFPNIPNNIDSALAEKLELSPASVNRKNYEFMSSDENWKVNLTREFLALSTKSYHRWEEFRAYLEIAFMPFLEIYSPIYFSRIGLRYKDVINRSELNLGNTPWPELLQPYMLGIITDTVVGSNVLNYTNVTEIGLSDNQSKVRISSSFVEEAQTNEKAFLIDCDFFVEQKIANEESLAKLDFFNQRGSRLIRWCITEKLHNAMEPENL